MQSQALRNSSQGSVCHKGVYFSMRIGIIGTSAIAGHFVEGARLAGGIDIAAVYSRSLETGEAFAREWKIPIVYTSLDALAESTAVDAAYIASPNAFHYSQSKRMLAGGKHVLLSLIHI